MRAFHTLRGFNDRDWYQCRRCAERNPVLVAPLNMMASYHDVLSRVRTLLAPMASLRTTCRDPFGHAAAPGVWHECLAIDQRSACVILQKTALSPLMSPSTTP